MANQASGPRGADDTPEVIQCMKNLPVLEFATVTKNGIARTEY
jgi:hypothetical protein